MLTPRKMYPRAVNVALSQEMYDRLAALRAATGATMPAVIRAAVERGLPRLEREVRAAADAAAEPAPAVADPPYPAPAQEAPEPNNVSSDASPAEPDAAPAEDGEGDDEELGRQIAEALADGGEGER